MELKLSPELETKLEQIASQQGRDPRVVAQEAIERLVQYEEWFFEKVSVGLEQVAQGQVVEHSEIERKIELLIRSHSK